MKTRIILLVDSSLFGGIESHLVQLSQLLVHHDVAFEVLFYQQHNNQQFYQQLEQHHINFTVLAGTFSALYQYLKQKTQPVVVHTHGYKAGILGRLACLMQRKAVVSTFHAGEIGLGRVKYYNLLDRISSILSINFAVSQPIAKKVHQATLIANFINPKTLHYQPVQSVINIGYVGRLSSEKGPDVFLSLAQMCQYLPQLSFHIFGDGPLKEQITSVPIVHYHGQCNNDEIWPQLDVLIVSSREEGMPMVILEAMNNGVAIISHPVGAIPTIIYNNQTGQISKGFGASCLKDALLHWFYLSEPAKQQQIMAAHSKVNRDFCGQSQFKLLQQGYQKALEKVSVRLTSTHITD